MEGGGGSRKLLGATCFEAAEVRRSGLKGGNTRVHGKACMLGGFLDLMWRRGVVIWAGGFHGDQRLSQAVGWGVNMRPESEPQPRFHKNTFPSFPFIPPSQLPRLLSFLPYLPGFGFRLSFLLHFVSG